MNKEKLKEMYIKMLHTRLFEEKVAYFFSMGMVHGTTHLYVGEEASAVGACCALETEDLITSTHRGHGHCIGKGIDLNRMMAELLGKSTGYCKGKGGSMHIADLERGNIGANGVVGGGHAIAVGAGLTLRMQKRDNVVVCFFGDGASNEGSFHEALNLASVWKLPVIFICENNLYGMSVPVSKSMNITDVADRAAAYGIKGMVIDGNDVLEVYKSVLEAKEYVKENGPILIEAKTYRWLGHSKSDANVYRTKEEIASWKEKCPIKRMRAYLESNQIFKAKELDEMEKQASEDMEKAVEFAQNSPYPSLDTIMDDVYA
ncbi:thiamine pyrophosphate-dependent dehydrogenase E1 component subunit alpha [Clostridiales bacterium BAD-6]|uniref:Thiamine pyrophosphate-dependent dehydrogenase E1 component subunit alpha n=1 Tax=Sinanaerobacter chloroacetimidivorans TaxID=2818044 RepID=A0A8J8B390_9FIRM|nr:thiamine pyrophosphate-dependent dehydrogenase E1 component subunit alpha [Sinanaerobacter chloroacetimidivorans]